MTDPDAGGNALTRLLGRSLSRRAVARALAACFAPLTSNASPEQPTHAQRRAGRGEGTLPGEPFFNVRVFGAKGDGRTDDSNAIAAALAAANASGESGFGENYGGLVIVPPGIYVVDRVVDVPPQTRFVGSGRNNTVLRASPRFDFSRSPSAVVRLNGFGSRIEHLSIDCADEKDSTGVFSNSINEQAGVFHVQVFGFRAFGIRVSNRPPSPLVAQNFELQDLELTYSLNAPPGVVGLLIDGAASSPRWIHGITINSMRLGHRVANSVGLSLQGVSVTAEALHLENVETGILLGTVDDCSGSDLAGISVGPNVNTALRIGRPNGEMNSYAVRGIRSIGKPMLLIDDLARDWRFSGEFRTFYAVGGGANPAVLTLDGAAKLHGVDLLAGGRLSVDGVPVLGQRDMGWQPARGAGSKGQFDVEEATTLDCAKRIKALEDMLRGHGLID